jgi:signal transduction histidine kinase/PAS domain-containing protein
MASTKNQFARAGKQDSLYPTERFVRDFTRLITDVDRLMADVGSATDKPHAAGKPNGEAQQLTLNGTISALQEHAQSLIRSLRHFEWGLDRIPLPFMELDEKARILSANKECADLFNGSATPLQGKSLFAFVAGPEVKRLREHLSVARRTNKPTVVQLSIARRGKTCPVELRTLGRSAGRVAWHIAVIQSPDGSNGTPTPGSKKQTASSMHELIVNLSHAQSLRSVADQVAKYCGRAFRSPAGIMFADHDGKLELISHWSKRVPQKYLAEESIMSGPAARVFRTGEPVIWHRDRMPRSKASRCIYRLLRRTQAQSITMVPIAATEQQPVGVLAVMLPHDNIASTLHDEIMVLGQIVSGCIVRARSYEEAVAARAKAEHAMQSKDEFLSILSHELKNPMMPILGWAVALSSQTLPADKQNHALEGIVRNVRALNHLVDDLFDTIRISSGKLRIEPAEIRIQDVAREALTAIQYTAERKKLRISTDISEAIPAFTADPHRLQQVLTNLLNNAVKFTPGGGSISLQIRRRGDTVECIVSDTGKGIEHKFLPFVFERFRQGNGSAKLHAAGLGLGLAIVHEIVELHGGTIEALSEGIDEGSTFIVRIPMRKRHSRQVPRLLYPIASHPGVEKKRKLNHQE